MRDIEGVAHVAFDTQPWSTIEDYEACRAKWEGYRGRDGAVLKTTEDFQRFEEYRAVQKTLGLKVSKADGAVGTARRMFLRALTRKAWGLEHNSMMYTMVADWLTAAGYPTSKEDLENAKRAASRLIPHAVPQTAAVQRFVTVVLERFPLFQTNLLLKIGE
jgi:hypothetical protein